MLVMTEENLAELANELRTQNNRCTAHPLYVVQQKRRIYGMDSAYCDDYEWHSEDHEYRYSDEEIQSAIQDEVELEHGPPVSDVDEVAGPRERDPGEYGYEKVYYIEYWDFVTAHLTERAANRYVRENAHNLNEPRVYVTSQYRCHEWIEVVQHLKRL